MSRLITRHGDSVFYTSPTLTADGASAVLPFGDGWSSGALVLIGSGLTTDETLALTADFFYDSAGTYPATALDTPLTANFTGLTASILQAVLWFPNALSALPVAQYLPPYVKFSHALSGTTKSMSYTIRRHLVGDLMVAQV